MVANLPLTGGLEHLKNAKKNADRTPPKNLKVCFDEFYIFKYKMPNANNYARNNSASYNISPTSVSQQYYMSSAPTYSNSNAPSASPSLYLSGPDTSGTVYVNNSFNVSREDPGISWVL